MKKLIIVSAIFFTAFQAKSMTLETRLDVNNNKGISLLQSLPFNTATLNVININSVKENFQVVKVKAENDVLVSSRAIPAPKADLNSGFANRFTTLFWYEGRNVYA